MKLTSEFELANHNTGPKFTGKAYYASYFIYNSDIT